SSSSEIGAFLKAAGEAAVSQSGRLIFALDATMSRQPTWDQAVTIQASMFDAVGKAGGLSVQLVFFRGIDECRASKWVINAAALRDLMLGIQCLSGLTQIAKVLDHAYRETTKAKVSALVFIGDAIEEDIHLLCQKAGELGLKGVRCFFFQDGYDVDVENGFREMARLTCGAYFHLGSDSAKELAELLGAVAVYARGGLKALSNSGKREARLLLDQMTK
ncbi:MAG: VWA domain-containing protein, partial [Desulfamplus sp.]|nr:VWA domain-containing protein [Desulfamplus sp.]